MEEISHFHANINIHESSELMYLLPRGHGRIGMRLMYMYITRIAYILHVPLRTASLCTGLYCDDYILTDSTSTITMISTHHAPLYSTARMLSTYTINIIRVVALFIPYSGIYWQGQILTKTANAHIWRVKF